MGENTPPPADDPGGPDGPGGPGTPDGPGGPGGARGPGDPDGPGGPDGTRDPGDPDGPGGPADSGGPDGIPAPDGPGGPGGARGPGDPDGPGGLGGSGAPGSPGGSDGTRAPDGPGGPGGARGPGDPDGPGGLGGSGAPDGPGGSDGARAPGSPGTPAGPDGTRVPGDEAAASRVAELAGGGYLGAARAARVVAEAPEAPDHVLDWLRADAAAGAWRRFGAFANLAAHIHPEGLTAVLAPVVADGTAPAGYEDLVEILGEVAEGQADPEAVSALLRLLAARAGTDPAPYALSLKTVEALGAIGGADAERALRDVAEDTARPDPVRWQAAVELGIEDELGFDEDEMTGPVH